MKNSYFREEIELHEQLKHLIVKCKCGHMMLMPVQQDFKICSYCGHKVLNNTKLYFLYKLRKELKNVKQR